ncbi:MAG: hypothetical protein Ta2F_07340 [Termitinemataceae bacterium]|nr:MAG: hypothetical protein Ta2F_07340 [Termitinemataceae bacterium]
MADGYQVVELTGSHLYVAIDLYNLLIKHNDGKDFIVGPFRSDEHELKLKVTFKKNGLVRVTGKLIIVPFIINLYGTSAILLTKNNGFFDENPVGIFYDILNVFRAGNIDVHIKVIDLDEKIVEEWKNNYVASTDEVLASAGNCLKDIDKAVDFTKEFEGFKSEDLFLKMFLEDTPNKYAQQIIKYVKDLYGGSKFRVCFCSDVHEYLVLVYSDVGVFHYKSLEFSRSNKVQRVLYKNIVKILNKDKDAPIKMDIAKR